MSLPLLVDGSEPQISIAETHTQCDILATASVNRSAPGALLMSLGSGWRSDSHTPHPPKPLTLVANSDLVRGQELNISGLRTWGIKGIKISCLDLGRQRAVSPVHLVCPYHCLSLAQALDCLAHTLMKHPNYNFYSYIDLVVGMEPRLLPLSPALPQLQPALAYQTPP